MAVIEFERAAMCPDCRVFFPIAKEAACPKCGSAEGWMLVPIEGVRPASSLEQQITTATLDMRSAQKEARKREFNNPSSDCAAAENMVDRLLIQWMKDQKKGAP